MRDFDYPPFCLRARDERAVACPAAATPLLRARSREARLRGESSTAENNWQGKQTRHGMQGRQQSQKTRGERQLEKAQKRKWVQLKIVKLKEAMH